MKFKEMTEKKSRHGLDVEGNHDSLLFNSPFTSSTSTKNLSGAFYSLARLVTYKSRKEVLNAAGPFVAGGPEYIKNIGHVDVA